MSKQNLFQIIRNISIYFLIFLFILSAGAVKTNANFTFASWADTKSGTSYLATLSKQLKSQINPVFTIFEGDLEDNGFTQTGMDAWKNALNGDLTGSTSNGTFDISLPVRGNHDSANVAGWQSYYDLRIVVGKLCSNKGGSWNSSAGICSGGSIGPVNFSEYSTDLTYSFDYENVHIVGIDMPGDKDAISSGTITWLDLDLAAAENRGMTISFVYSHGPVWPISYHCCTQSNPAFDQVLYKHKSVAATFHGHEHIYAYSHISNARVANTTTATGHEFEQFHTGNAGAEGGESCPVNSYAGCKPERWDYFMGYGNTDVPRGFTAIDVSGNNFTVKFYKINAATPDETLTFTHDTATGYTRCTAYNPYHSEVDFKLASVCSGLVVTPTAGPTPTPSRTPTPTPGGPNPISSPTPTPGGISGGFRFVSWSDAQDQGLNLYRTSNAAASLNPAFTIFNGDFSDDGVLLTGTDSMDNMTKAMKGNPNGVGTLDNGIFGKTFLVRGNHDNHYSNPAEWQNYFISDTDAQGTMGTRVSRIGGRNYAFMAGQDNQTYSFDYGNSRFIAIDVPGSVSISSTQKTFLTTQLEAAKTDSQIQHVFIYFHGPVYCTSYHCSCTAAKDTACEGSGTTTMIGLINAYPKISATFHGHEHILGWTHLDSTRITSLGTRTYEQFMTAPSGQDNYDYLYSKPNRMTYEDMPSTDAVQGFAAVDVDGLNFTVRQYRIGSGIPLTCKQAIVCSKNSATGNTSCTNSANCGQLPPAPSSTPVLTPTSGISPIPSKTPTPAPSKTPTLSPSATPILTPTATPIPGSTRDVSFTESSENFPNPERGFYGDIEYWPGTTNYPDYAGIHNRGYSLAHTYIRLDNYRTIGTIPTSGLTTLFNNARLAHIKLMLRVTYNFNMGDPDASEAIINQHLSQLKPILETNKDVIYVWQAGYMGAWGEWHSSTNFNMGTDGNGADITTTKRIFLNILNNLPVGVFSAVRYPGFRIPFFGSAYMQPAAAYADKTAHPESWTGFHNDCFLAGSASYPDEGSYNVSGMNFQQVKDYYHNETKYVPLTGETCALTARSTCAIATSELSYMRWSSLNADFDTSVLDKLNTEGCLSDITLRLGYRLVLTKITLPSQIYNTGFMPIHFELKNTGYAPLYYERPAYLVFENKTTGAKTQIKLTGTDPRGWLPVDDIPLIKFDASVDISSIPAGSYKIYLWLPDNNPSLKSIPDYAVRLANTNIWSSSTGYNYLTDADISTGVSGDANGDGKIDAADMGRWLLGYLNQGTGPGNGDFDGNGKTDGKDFILWLTNYGK